jgi:hypothetical protein
MNKQHHRFTSPLETDNWKQRVREILSQPDNALEAGPQPEPEPEPEPFYFVAAAPTTARFTLPTNVLGALNSLSDIG